MAFKRNDNKLGFCQCCQCFSDVGYRGVSAFCSYDVYIYISRPQPEHDKRGYKTSYPHAVELKKGHGNLLTTNHQFPLLYVLVYYHFEKYIST